MLAIARADNLAHLQVRVRDWISYVAAGWVCSARRYRVRKAIPRVALIRRDRVATRRGSATSMRQARRKEERGKEGQGLAPARIEH